MRPEAEVQRLFPLMVLANLILTGAFVWIYSRGIESRSWCAQGVRFGAAAALLTIVPTYLTYYIVQPMPGILVAKQIAFDRILVLLLGVLAAMMLRKPGAGPKPEAARHACA